jgi:hypothetical protein
MPMVHHDPPILEVSPRESLGILSPISRLYTLNLTRLHHRIAKLLHLRPQRAAAGSPGQTHAQQEVDDGRYVNTSRGGSLGSILACPAPGSPSSFVQQMSSSIQQMTLVPAQRRRRQHIRVPPSTVPRRSSRLAKKSKSIQLVVAAAQNVLMQKLGFINDTHNEADDFERYLFAFNEGLSDAPVEMIRELFTCRMPPSERDTVTSHILETLIKVINK